MGMLKKFKDRRTERYYTGQRVREFQGFTKAQASKPFGYLEAATTLEDLMMIPSNHFEALRGDRKGQYSIRINRQWRICFTWVEGEPHEIELSKHYG